MTGGGPFRLVLGVSALATCGYALLLSVVPLWVARGGAGAFGAGAGTGVFMAATVATQLGVPWLLRRFSHRVLLGAGLLLLGVPAPLLALSSALLPVLLLSLLRGAGFGLFTVVGNALVAEMVPAAARGRAAALFGLATGLPQLLLLPTGVVAADRVGFGVVFGLAAVPVLGLALLRFPPVRTLAGQTGPPPVPLPVPSPGPRGMTGPVAAMAVCAVAQGSLITFLPLAVAGPAVVSAALFGTAGGALLGRLAAGELVDRRGLGGRLLRPGTLVALVGMLAECASAGTGSPAGVVAGALLVGVGFGLVQNDSLVALFGLAGPSGFGRASAAWNVAYDAGTGLGALGLGVVAQLAGFRAAFGAAAVLLFLVVPLAGPRHRQGRGAGGPADVNTSAGSG
jgi:predicted MFS family arabinose efflux permease